MEEKRRGNYIGDVKINDKPNNVFGPEDIIFILKNPHIDVNFRNSVVAIYGAQIASSLAAIVAFIAKPNIYLMVLSLVIALQTPILFVLYGAIFKETDGINSKYLSASLFALELPLIYCFSGGMNGIGLLWYMFSFLLISIMFVRKEAIPMFLMNFLLMSITITVTEIKPNLILPINADTLKANNIACALIISVTVGSVILLQELVSNSDHQYMSDLQREIENSRDELEASNEEIIAINTNLLDTTDQLNELLKEKDREMKSQQRFTAMLNHELRNPLNGIMGNLQVSLMDETISEKMQKRCMHLLSQCCKRLMIFWISQRCKKVNLTLLSLTFI